MSLGARLNDRLLSLRNLIRVRRRESETDTGNSNGATLPPYHEPSAAPPTDDSGPDDPAQEWPEDLRARFPAVDFDNLPVLTEVVESAGIALARDILRVIEGEIQDAGLPGEDSERRTELVRTIARHLEQHLPSNDTADSATDEETPER